MCREPLSPNHPGLDTGIIAEARAKNRLIDDRVGKMFALHMVLRPDTPMEVIKDVTELYRNVVADNIRATDMDIARGYMGFSMFIAQHADMRPRENRREREIQLAAINKTAETAAVLATLLIENPDIGPGEASLMIEDLGI